MIRTYCDHCNTELHDRPYCRPLNNPRTHFPVNIAGLEMAVQVQWPQGIVLDLCDECFQGHTYATLAKVYNLIKSGYEWCPRSQQWEKREEATIEIINKGLNKS